MISIRVKLRTERGAAAIEFALVMPFLMLILFGIISTGMTYSDHLAVTNAVREGARFASAVDYTDSHWASDVETRVQQVYFNAGSTLDASHVCVALVPKSGADLVTAGTDCGAQPAFDTAKMASGSCVVKVWLQKAAQIELIVAPTLNFNIGASSVSYYGRQVDKCMAK